MATAANTRPATAGDARFFVISAMLMAAVIVGGFSMNLAMGRSSFAAPPVYHVHAAFFFGWVALYLVQTTAIATGAVGLHRTLGWVAVAWIPAMLVAGALVVRQSLTSHGGPPFFDTREFLFGNAAGLGYFAAFAGAAIVLRRRTDWHRRLLFCAMASLTGPGFGRLLPVPFMIPWAWWVSAVLAPALFPIAGMIRDRRRHGRVHPAWAWGLGGLIAAMLIADLIAFSPAGSAITRMVVAGTPGDDGDFAPHFP